MLKLRNPLTAGAFVTLTFLGAAPAKADAITYVSGTGTDAGNCSSPANPCRTFQFAVSQTLPGGEVKALDPADYGAVKITKSISITGVVGASIQVTSPDQTAVDISSSNSFTVINLANLTLAGPTPPGGRGVAFSLAAPEFVGSSLTMINCIARNFGTGIGIVGAGKSSFTNVLIKNTIVTNNSVGVSLIGVRATVVGSVVANNTDTGIATGGGSFFQLASTTVTGNRTGAALGNEGVSFGDNHIYGNRTDLIGTLTNVRSR